jgi:hypothetical protein
LKNGKKVLNTITCFIKYQILYQWIKKVKPNAFISRVGEGNDCSVVRHAYLITSESNGFSMNHWFRLYGLVESYTCKNPQVITNQQETWKQCCFNNSLSGCVRSACSQLVDKLLKACWQLATRLLSFTNLLQVVPITCYRPAIQQSVTKLRATATL